jgi:hypothetical protein
MGGKKAIFHRRSNPESEFYQRKKEKKKKQLYLPGTGATVIRLRPVTLVLWSVFLPWSFGLMPTGFTALGTKLLRTVLQTAHFSGGLDVKFLGIVPISVQYFWRTRNGGAEILRKNIFSKIFVEHFLGDPIRSLNFIKEKQNIAEY